MGQFLQCDAPGCDHREMRPALLEEDIGRPCPKCGANLLTREDYEAAKPFSDMMRAMEEAGLIKPASLDDVVGEGKAIVTINHHAGDINIKIKGSK